MNAKQYEEARRRLLLSHSKIGTFFGRSKRTSVRYAMGDEIPDVVSMMLALMLECKLDPPGVRAIEKRWWGKSKTKLDGDQK